MSVTLTIVIVIGFDVIPPTLAVIVTAVLPVLAQPVPERTVNLPLLSSIVPQVSML